jgi:hypothetical protein
MTIIQKVIKYLLTFFLLVQEHKYAIFLIIIVILAEICR